MVAFLVLDVVLFVFVEDSELVVGHVVEVVDVVAGADDPDPCGDQGQDHEEPQEDQRAGVQPVRNKVGWQAADVCRQGIHLFCLNIY